MANVTTSRYRIGMSADPANNFDLEPDGAGSLLIKRVSNGAKVGKVDANGNLLGKVPMVSVITTGGQSIPSNAFTLVPYDVLQSGSGFNTAAGMYRFQPTIPGWYQINSSVALGLTGTTTNVTSSLFFNGVEYRRGTQMSITGTGLSIGSFPSQVSVLVYFNGTSDYADIRVFSNASGSNVISTSPYMVWFQAYLASADL